MQKETVIFKFNDQSWVDNKQAGSDPSMEAANHANMGLGTFLSRPVKISQQIWTSDDAASAHEVDPWDAFLSHPTVARKIANFKLFKGKLHVKFVINGSPFLYGKLMAVYHPLHAFDAFAPANIPDRICRLSQRQHVYLNPTTSSGGELVLPFFWQYNAVHVVSREYRNLGHLTLLPISSLKHSAGEDPSCTVTMFAWMEDVELTQPTSSIYNGQMSESDGKIVSKTATAMGNAAGALSRVPLIGPYARASEEVFNMLGRWADLFGFTKARNTHDLSDYRTRFAGTIAPTNDKDESRLLTLDVKQEVTVDPTTVGLSSEDEMSIPHLCNIEALVKRFTWRTSDAPDHELTRIPVTPFIRATFPSDGKVDTPPCAYVASFFKYWRGTMQYRFIVNASAFHRGKLRFRYEPYAIADQEAYNVVQSEIIDLTECHDHKVEIGWGSDRNYLLVTGSFKQPINSEYTAELDTHNGNLIVSVANNLVVPDEASDDSVDILMAVNMAMDAEFAVPTENVLTDMKLVADISSTVPDLPPSGTAFTQPVSQNTGDPGIFYYGWHTNNFHNDQGYLRDQLDVPHFPEVPGLASGEYDDTVRAVVRAQFDVMLKSGIKFVVASWFGPGSREDTQLDTLKLEAGTVTAGTMEFCCLYETAILKNHSPTNEFEFTSQEVKDKFRSDMTYYKLNHVGNENYYNKPGTSQPVFFIYLLRVFSIAEQESMCSILRSVMADNAIGGVSYNPYIVGDLMFGTPKNLGYRVGFGPDCLSVYDVYGQSPKKIELDESDVSELHGKFAQWAQLNPNEDIWPVVSPGYNDRGVRLSANHTALSRNLNGFEKGSLFKAHLKHLDAISTVLPNQPFLINTWNEWHEDSQIEPAGGAGNSNTPTELTNGVTYEPYGTKYVNILGEFVVGGSYVAQSLETYIGHSEEMDNEHLPQTNPETTILEKPATHSPDDLIYFGERVASLRTIIKRYTRYVMNTTDSSFRSTFTMPAYPEYLWDNQNTSLVETLLTRVGVLFLGRRGSTRWKVFPDYRNSTPRISTIRLTDNAELGVVDDIPALDIFGYGWHGTDVTIGVNDPVGEWEVPYYSNARFHLSRSLINDDPVRHQHTYDGAAVFRNHYVVAAGDDLQYFYFVGTPSVTFT
jgi:hypothetical protein